MPSDEIDLALAHQCLAALGYSLADERGTFARFEPNRGMPGQPIELDFSRGQIHRDDFLFALEDAGLGTEAAEEELSVLLG